ncbi:MAG: HNH endonuclease [Thermoguttaceae bacterium]
MTSTYIPAGIRQRVRRRAKGCCEYCLLAEQDSFFVHEPDHIVAEKHGGATTADNLALACFDCNRFKGSDIASLDPRGGGLVRLFNPRTDVWAEHFQVEAGRIRPLTDVARATERLLKLNLPVRVEIRVTLARLGRYPG